MPRTTCLFLSYWPMRSDRHVNIKDCCPCSWLPSSTWVEDPFAKENTELSHNTWKNHIRTDFKLHPCWLSQCWKALCTLPEGKKGIIKIIQMWTLQATSDIPIHAIIAGISWVQTTTTWLDLRLNLSSVCWLSYNKWLKPVSRTHGSSLMPPSHHIYRVWLFPNVSAL